jgi:enediyne biosynthesis protein E4
LSSVDPVVHIGLGISETVDSLVVQWSATDVENPKRFRLRDIEANQTVRLRYSESESESAQNEIVRVTAPLFEETSEDRGLVWRQEIRPFDDFHLQPLIPYQLSDHGTGFEVGDLTGNGLDDIIAGGTAGQSPVMFIQNEEGRFDRREFSPEGDPDLHMYEDASLLLFDANGNGLNDLYIASGGVRHTAGNSLYRDRFYQNTGDGQFVLIEDAVPDDAISSSVVIAADFNENGKPDLFVGGRVTPGRYPEAVPSRILINETDEHGIRFRDATYDLAPALLDLSAVNDAVWTDFSGNGRPDLVIASEWSPVLFFENRGEGLVDVTDTRGLPESAGWWFSITETDLTGNGLPDFIAGNIGRNELLRPSSDEPVSIYYGDLTDNGFFEAITTHYVKDEEGRRQEFIYHHREDLFRAMPETGERMPSHEEFGRTTFGQFLTRDEKNRARHKRVTSFDSVVLLNRGDGTFEERPLPASAQSSALFTAVPVDVDGNEVQSLLLAGNLAGADVQMGSYNAFNGLLLKGRGDGSFQTVSPAESGFRMSGDTRGWSPLRLADDKEAILIQLSTGEFRLWQGGGNQ